MTKQFTQFLAPAKLNLFLHILGRREDGYHELQTVFQLLDFGDQMAFEVSNNGILSLHLSFSDGIDPVLQRHRAIQPFHQLRNHYRNRWSSK